MNVPQDAQEGLLKHRRLDPIPRVCESVGLGWAWEPAFLSCHVMLILLVQQPHSENHLCSEIITMSRSEGPNGTKGRDCWNPEGESLVDKAPKMTL